MKCSKCGFISNRDFYRCPYCGQTHEDDTDLLKTRLNIGSNFSVQIRTIVIALVCNIFGLSVLLDWYFDFAYSITLWSFIINFGSLLLFDLITNKKRNVISIIERIDLFIVAALLLCCPLLRIEGVFDFRIYTPTFIIPGFIIIATLVSTILLFKRQGTNTKLRPLWTELLLIFHVLITTLNFIFFLINKYCVANGVANPPFAYYMLGMTSGNPTLLYTISEILIYASFGLSLIYLINYNIILVGFIARKVKNIYGGPRD